jgi:hypothetical protein
VKRPLPVPSLPIAFTYFPRTAVRKKENASTEQIMRERVPCFYADGSLPEFDAWLSPTRVGAILRLFFSCPPSSFSLSPASRLTPLTLLVVLRGVWGGVVIGMLGMNPKGFPATTPDMFPARSGGLLMTVPAGALTYEACVPTEEVEFDRVGEKGRAEGPAGAGGGDGAMDRLDEVR